MQSFTQRLVHEYIHVHVHVHMLVSQNIVYMIGSVQWDMK